MHSEPLAAFQARASRECASRQSRMRPIIGMPTPGTCIVLNLTTMGRPTKEYAFWSAAQTDAEDLARKHPGHVFVAVKVKGGAMVTDEVVKREVVRERTLHSITEEGPTQVSSWRYIEGVGGPSQVNNGQS